METVARPLALSLFNNSNWSRRSRRRSLFAKRGDGPTGAASVQIPTQETGIFASCHCSHSRSADVTGPPGSGYRHRSDWGYSEGAKYACWPTKIIQVGETRT